MSGGHVDIFPYFYPWCGIPEVDGGNDEKVLSVLNGKKDMQPPVQRQHIERRHRLGPHRRGLINERLRDDVYRVPQEAQYT